MRLAKSNSAPAWITELVETLPPLCSVNEAAKALRVSRKTLGRLVEKGRLKAIRYVHGEGSSPLRFSRAELERFLLDVGGDR